MPTSRKSAMASRVWANLRVQIRHRPPGGERCRVTPVSRAQYTGDSWGGKKPIVACLHGQSKTKSPRMWGGVWSLTDHASTRIGFSGLLAGHQDIGKGPQADGAMAVRATPDR